MSQSVEIEPLRTYVVISLQLSHGVNPPPNKPGGGWLRVSHSKVRGLEIK